MTRTMKWGVSVARIRDDDVYGRAQSDAAFLQRLREGHGGQWDVLDALWWESHPLDVAPSGIPAPAAALRELQRRLFSQGGDAGGDHATTELMRELEATISAEREAIRDAIERAQSPRHPQRHSDQTDADVARMLEVELGPEPGDSVPETPSLLGAPPARRNLAMGISIAAALVGGIVVGIQLTGGTADAAPPAPAVTPGNTAPGARTAPPVVTLDIGAIAPVGVFDRGQAESDIPGLVMPAIFDAASFRNLNHFPDSGNQPPARIYAARTTSNMMCLVVVISADDYVSTCTLERDFPSTGLRVHWKAPMEVIPEGGEPVAVPTDQHAVWGTDGNLMWGSVGA